jgi:hypothetical protein
MAWDVDFHSLFVPEFQALDQDVQDELLAHADALKVFGPRWDGRASIRWWDRATRT